MMKEFFTKNKFQITVLIAVLLFILIIGVGVFISKNDSQSEALTTEKALTKQEEQNGQVSSISTTRDVTEALKDALKDAERIEVGNDTKLPKYYSYTIQKTDSQTRATRKIIAEFSKTYRKLQNWERTYLETNIVTALGRKEIVNPGDSIQISYEMLTEYAQRLTSLSSAEIQKWETFSHNTIFFDQYDGVETGY